MTAEIAILNRSAISLAADSALTVGRNRVWKNTNKLFALSTYNDIGVMIFGSGDFCGISWEVIIKQFRKSISNRRFKTVSECTDEFRLFLNSFDVPGNDTANLNSFFVVLETISECMSHIKNGKALDRRRQLSRTINQLIDSIEEYEVIIDNISIDDYIESHSGPIREFLKTETDIHATNPMFNDLINLCFERTRRNFSSTFETGVVFAGYGEDELLPHLQEWTIDGKYQNYARAWLSRDHDLNKEDASPAVVIPFAQTDIAYLFMEGMQLDYLDFLNLTIKQVLDTKSERLIDSYVSSDDRHVELLKQKRENGVIVRTFMDEFRKMRKQAAIDPMLDVISSLPKEEMADMAEALVEITSLRRKIDSRIESVGGPVDVAVISKSDGFVWIKRKHYFSLDLNPDFMVRRANRFGDRGYERSSQGSVQGEPSDGSS